MAPPAAQRSRPAKLTKAPTMKKRSNRASRPGPLAANCIQPRHRVPTVVLQRHTAHAAVVHRPAVAEEHSAHDDKFVASIAPRTLKPGQEVSFLSRSGPRARA